MQRVSLDRSTLGLDPSPLIAGDAWWTQIRSGDRPVEIVAGRIDEVSFTGMGDYPEFRIAGRKHPTTREGDARRYAVGLSARVRFVEHPWKPGRDGTDGLGDTSSIALSIEIERSTRRSSAVAPGPGGAGYALARREGAVVHFLRFDGERDAQAVASEVAGAMTARHDRYLGLWIVPVWRPDAAAATDQRDELREIAHTYAGAYDGGEVVGGSCLDADP